VEAALLVLSAPAVLETLQGSLRSRVAVEV